MLFGFMSSCKSKQITKKAVSSDVENFDEFYKQFHQDVNFQMSRIVFPLVGKLVDGMETYSWSKNNWAPMKVMINDVDKKQYKVSASRTNNIFEQKIWIPNSGFKSEYKFELINKKWMLVYALEQNI